MKILIAGDLVPTQVNNEEFIRSNFLEYNGKEFQDIWSNAEYRIFNLECPLGENNNGINKNGEKIHACSKCINGIKSLNPNLILLSNNHIMDYDEEALNNTVKLLNENNINWTGIVKNNYEEFQPYFFEVNGKKICIYNVCENEFSVASEEKIGANALNEAKNCREIQKAKSCCDYLIVIFHGGKEFYRFPSPNLQRICRSFVDFGADFVITQHSHCIGCFENYNAGKILYGQGNFIFDCGIDDEFWKTSLIVEIDIEKDNVSVNYIPIETKNGFINISKDKTILEKFYERSKMIQSQELIRKNYSNFAKDNLNMYLGIINKPNIFKRILNRLFKRKFYLKLYSKENCLKILNIIECEAHRELFITGLKERIKEINNED